MASPTTTTTSQPVQIEAIDETPGSTTTTSTTVDPTSTTTTVQAGSTESTQSTTTTTSQPASVSPEATGSTAFDTLPFTGPRLYLVAPGVLMVIFGMFAIAVSGGTRAAHVAHDSVRFGLGLRRGRHER